MFFSKNYFLKNYFPPNYFPPIEQVIDDYISEEIVLYCIPANFNNEIILKCKINNFSNEIILDNPIEIRDLK